MSAERPSKLRLVIADDEEMVRSGLRMVIDAQPDLAVVGEAADGREALEAARRTKPDVVLMDIRMPQLDGIEATRRLLDALPSPRVVMLTTFDDDETLYEALRAGASGFLLKVSPPEQLLDAIRAVGSGHALIDPHVTRRVLESFARQPGPAAHPPELEELTAREREVLELLACGLSNREIAAELFISGATAKTHVVRILAKLDLRDRCPGGGVRIRVGRRAAGRGRVRWGRSRARLSVGAPRRGASYRCAPTRSSPSCWRLPTVRRCCSPRRSTVRSGCCSRSRS